MDSVSPNITIVEETNFILVNIYEWLYHLSAAIIIIVQGDYLHGTNPTLIG